MSGADNLSGANNGSGASGTPAARPGGIVSPTPRIEQRAGFCIVGVGCDAGPGNTGPIAEAWDRFFKVPPPAEQQGVLAAFRFTGEGAFHYTAAYRVPAWTAAPAGFESVDIPAQNYAIWRFEGDPAGIADAYMALFGEYLAAAGLTADMDGIHLEDYPADGWDPATGVMKADFCIAIN